MQSNSCQHSLLGRRESGDTSTDMHKIPYFTIVCNNYLRLFIASVHQSGDVQSDKFSMHRELPKIEA
jgi:hypothetical protein